MSHARPTWSINNRPCCEILYAQACQRAKPPSYDGNLLKDLVSNSVALIVSIPRSFWILPILRAHSISCVSTCKAETEFESKSDIKDMQLCCQKIISWEYILEYVSTSSNSWALLNYVKLALNIHFYERYRFRRLSWTSFLHQSFSRLINIFINFNLISFSKSYDKLWIIFLKAAKHSRNIDPITILTQCMTYKHGHANGGEYNTAQRPHWRPPHMPLGHTDSWHAYK